MMPEKRIVRFVDRHHVMTLATVAAGQAWCSSLFYAYIEERNAFVVTSALSTRHAQEAASDPRVAASIVLESRTVGKLQGLQIEGTMAAASATDFAAEARRAYIARFPYAVFADLDLWIITPTHLKLTDNRLGFGKKLTWKRSL